MTCKRKYPRFGATRKKQREAPCIVCDEPTRQLVDVQWSYMRGDDDVERVCSIKKHNVAAVIKAINATIKPG